MLDRRALLKGSLATASLLAGAPLLRASPLPRKAPRLRQGDTIGLVAPAGFIADRFGLEAVVATVEAMGLVARPARHMLDRNGYLAGDDKARAADINAMFADKDVRAVFAVRGGWGSQRVLPFLDFELIHANPKLLIGSRDITALHLALARFGGTPSIHGPNLVHSWSATAWDSLHALAFEAATPTYANPPPAGNGLPTSRWPIRSFRQGIARGRLLGGNLSVLSALVGTPYLPDFTGAILFLEDTNEAEYRIDRMLTQLGQSGLLERVAGVVFGQCTRCENPGGPFSNFTIYQVLEQHFAPLGVPAFQGALIGHITDQISIPVGIDAEIDAGQGTIRILEPVVA